MTRHERPSPPPACIPPLALREPRPPRPLIRVVPVPRAVAAPGTMSTIRPDVEVGDLDELLDD